MPFIFSSSNKSFRTQSKNQEGTIIAGADVDVDVCEQHSHADSKGGVASKERACMLFSSHPRRVFVNALLRALWRVLVVQLHAHAASSAVERLCQDHSEHS